MLMSDKSNRLPDFYCIGVQKAGTTWVYENLSNHPAFCMPFLKEVDFFNYRHLPHQRGWILSFLQKRCLKSIQWHLTEIDKQNFEKKKKRIQHICALALDPFTQSWYSKIFEECPSHLLCGDITPEYSLLDEVGIRDILTFTPNAKFILMLRDPIERDFSHACMQLRNSEIISEDDFIRVLSQAGLIARSDYPAIIQRWEQELPNGNLKIFFYDDIIKRPQQLLIEIVNFLGTKTLAQQWIMAEKIIHQGRKITMPQSILELLTKRHRENIKAMAEIFPAPCIDWWDRYYR